jgi:hypothetical protein
MLEEDSYGSDMCTLNLEKKVQNNIYIDNKRVNLRIQRAGSMFKQEFLSKKKNNVQTRNCKLENINKKYSKINFGRFKLIFHIKIKN